MNRQLKKLSSFLLALMLTSIGVGMQAQTELQADTPAPRMKADATKLSAEERKAKLYDQLNLDVTQKAKVDALLATQKEELVALRNSDLDRPEKRERIESLKSQHLDQMGEILSVEQLTTYKEVIAKQKRKKKGKLKGKRKAKGLE